jgi:hypothetical protein
MALAWESHSWEVLSQWDTFLHIIRTGAEIRLKGENLDIATVVAVARSVAPASCRSVPYSMPDMELA